jgi:hypothetical protein
MKVAGLSLDVVAYVVPPQGFHAVTAAEWRGQP